MMNDLRLALRTLRRAPGFTITAALTLALGIGVTSLMFSVVNAVLLRPQPYADPSRLVYVFSENSDARVGQIRASALDFDDWRTRAHSFDAMAAHIGTGFTFTGTGQPELAVGLMVTADLFKVLGVQPALGRVFTPDEFTPGRADVVVLSHRLWMRRFGGDPSIVGRKVQINNRPFTVLGVMPASFEYSDHVYQLWTPLPNPRTADLPPINRGTHYLQVVARLKPGVTPEQADTEMRTLAASLAAQYPDSDGKLSAKVTPLTEYAVRDVKTPLYVLLSAVGLVVLIACANVTNLLLARATARSREVAIRQALGAARWRLVRQFLAETLVLYAAGAAGGLGLASWGASALVAFGPDNIPRLENASVDGRVLAATLLLCLATATVFGLVPALQGSAGRPVDALRAGGRGAAGGGVRQRIRMVLVVAELALAVVLLVGAGLMMRSLVRLTSVDPGFDADGQLTFSLVLAPRRFPDAAHLAAAAMRVAEDIAATPGVVQAGATTWPSRVSRMTWAEGIPRTAPRTYWRQISWTIAAASEGCSGTPALDNSARDTRVAIARQLVRNLCHVTAEPTRRAR